MKTYVDKETPSDVQQSVLELLEKARQSGGRIRKGTNEATKSIERGDAKLVVIAGDVDPEEIVMHLPLLSKEKHIAYCFINAKADLGKAAGLGLGTSAVAISSPGTADAELKKILEKLGADKAADKAAAKATEAKEEKAAAPAKKKKAAVVKETVAVVKEKE